MKQMQANDIPDFVAEVIALGCDIRAIGHDGYVIGDADLPDDVYRRVSPKLQQVSKRYGSRDHLHEQIVAHLHFLGRVYWHQGMTVH